VFRVFTRDLKKKKSPINDMIVMLNGITTYGERKFLKMFKLAFFKSTAGVAGYGFCVQHYYRSIARTSKAKLCEPDAPGVNRVPVVI